MRPLHAVPPASGQMPLRYIHPQHTSVADEDVGGYQEFDEAARSVEY